MNTEKLPLISIIQHLAHQCPIIYTIIKISIELNDTLQHLLATLFPCHKKTVVFYRSFFGFYSHELSFVCFVFLVMFLKDLILLVKSVEGFHMKPFLTLIFSNCDSINDPPA